VISRYWSVLLFAGAVLVLAIVGYALWRGRRRSETSRVMRSISVASLHDVLLPNGMGGQTHFGHVLLTARGLLVLEVKSFRGAVFGSDRMDEWTVIGPRRFTFPNPQPALLDRVAVLKLLAKDVPVEGYIVFEPGADFSKGRPKHVIFAAELQSLYQKPARAELERIVEAFAPQWERVKEAVTR
jgi:Nuclease-related domain